MKHTQSKWNVKEARENLNGLSSFVSYQVVNDDKVVIAKETTEANANLIAAVPEMFKALKAMTKLFEERVPYPNNTQRYKQAIKAIAKAEGK
jgi:hypothetical protein